MNWIAKRIRETRKVKGITQEELAEQAKVNLRTVQRIENSESDPRGKTLNLICDVLDIDSKELIAKQKPNRIIHIGEKLVTGFFLVILNLVLVGAIGFLTIDSNANINSRFAGFLLSIFLPFFIVVLSKNISGFKRTLRFGLGYFVFYSNSNDVWISRWVFEWFVS